MLAELASNRGRFHEMLRSLVDAADMLRGVVPGDYASISLDLHLDGIQAGNLPALQGLLDLLGITAPIGDVIDALGLGDLLGGLGGLLPRTTPSTASPTGADPPGGPGGRERSDQPAVARRAAGRAERPARGRELTCRACATSSPTAST